MKPRLTHESRILLLATAGALPAAVTALLLLWLGDLSSRFQWTVSLLIAFWWIGFAIALRERLVRPIQTLSNLIAALTEGDYSIRAREARSEETLGLAYWEVNRLTTLLQEQRLGAMEAGVLLGKVMGEIDVAVFAVDEDDRLRMVNPAGANLLGAAPADLMGRLAREVGLQDALEGETPRVIETPLGGGRGRWELRRGTFRQEGRPHRLLLLSDLSRTLREEERLAWKRLVRVLSHEINNSLAPIQSMSASLQALLRRHPRPEDWESDADRGLEVMRGRAEALTRFMQSYARLARLPPPKRRPLSVEGWVRRVAKLETRLPVTVQEGLPLTIEADGDQLDQMLINLVANAVDATSQTGGGVRVGWTQHDGALDVWVEDDGPGVGETANLFVPFFTTKPGGSGIGLTLSRQIAEGHGGTLTLESREGRQGCVARVRLPLVSRP